MNVNNDRCTRNSPGKKRCDTRDFVPTITSAETTHVIGTIRAIELGELGRKLNQNTTARKASNCDSINVLRIKWSQKKEVEYHGPIERMEVSPTTVKKANTSETGRAELIRELRDGALAL
jgi:hypothetical protein